MAVLLFATAIATSPGEDEMRLRCADKWPDDFRMQDYCFEQQGTAAVELAERTRGLSPQSDEAKAAAMCANRWHDRFGYDFRMVLYCWDEQLEALDRIRRR